MIRTGVVFALADWVILLLSTQVWNRDDPHTWLQVLAVALPAFGLCKLTDRFVYVSRSRTAIDK